MRQTFDSEQQYGGRTEYAEQSTEDRLEECMLITDILDELLETPHDSGGTIASTAHSDNYGFSQFRSFNYLETERGAAPRWSLLDKTIEIRYIRSKNQGEGEQYHVAIATRIHQRGVSRDPILNVYQIDYFGTDRASVTASIDEPDIIGVSEYEYTTRPTTSYDHDMLFTELDHLTDMLRAQERENSYIV